MATRRSTASGGDRESRSLLVVLVLFLALRLVAVFSFDLVGADPLAEHFLDRAMEWARGEPASAEPWMAPVPVLVWRGLLVVARLVLAPRATGDAFLDALRQSPLPIILLGRLAACLFATFALVWLHRFLFRRHGRGAAVTASLLFAVAPLAVGAVGTASPECLASLLLLMALGRGVEIFERGRGMSYLWAGLWGGLAAATQGHFLLLIGPFLWVHVRSRRLPRKSFLESCVDPRWLGFVLVFVLVFALAHLPGLLAGAVSTVRGLGGAALNDEIHRGALVVGGNHDGFEVLHRLARAGFGPVLGALALLLVVAGLAFRGFEKERIFSVWILLRLAALVVAPAGHELSLAAEIPVLALVMAVMIGLFLRRARIDPDGAFAFLLAVALVVPSGSELIRWGRSHGRRGTDAILRERAAIWKLRPDRLVQIGSFFPVCAVEENLLDAPLRGGLAALVEHWDGRIPSVDSLGHRGLRHVVIDTATSDWLFAHLPDGGRRLRLFLDDLGRAARTRCVVRGEAGRATGPKVEVFWLGVDPGSFPEAGEELFRDRAKPGES